MMQAQESFDFAEEIFVAMFEDIRDNETDESFQKILSGFKLDRETVDAMITEYYEEVSNG
jgi:transcription termination factor NusB